METHSSPRSEGTFPACEKTALPDLLILSHVRWNLVAHSQPHLVRWARERRVFFIEEPRFRSPAFGVSQNQAERRPLVNSAELLLKPQAARLMVVTPRLASGIGQSECVATQRRLVDRLLKGYGISDFMLWYHTPMALGFTRHLTPRGVIYDCMDELIGCDCAPQKLRAHEVELFAHADEVVTCQADKARVQEPREGAVSFSSSVDPGHFLRARNWESEPADQASIARPRIGCFGVIDERMDLELIAGIAQARPAWQLVLIGPLGKIDLSRLPRRRNIHYLGLKTYQELPAYLSGWDAAIMPFARNEATRGMSPVKTAEYLAAGRPVVSTGIPDVVSPFGEKGLVRIADTLPDFLSALDASLNEPASLPSVRIDVPQPTWDATWQHVKTDRSGAIETR